jgi:hypothetical protein
MATIEIVQSPETVGGFQIDDTVTVRATEFLQKMNIPAFFLQYVPYPIKEQDGVRNRSQKC